jgi:RNA polymerase sigma-70 factor (ECF subfamily)
MFEQELIPHLFRTEFSKIAAVLSKTFGIDHIETAEDLASETFLAALETWPYRGVPPNPRAWLYTVAKNKARNYLGRQQLFAGKISAELQKAAVGTENLEIDLSEKNISDSQLQMLFAICHPAIHPEAQVALALRILCGFGIDEIAHAFLSNKETINKRLFRAREKLREEKVPIEFPAPGQISQRLDNVLTILYLLFNEGYYSETDDAIIRDDLCKEAMRLARLLLENELTNLPRVNALYALMCFHASRFKARKDEKGQIVLYQDQDESLWDQDLISEGGYYLHLASQGDQLSKYHLEAGIAYWHTIKTDSREKWENILQLYNRLLQLEYSPIAALNRTFALAKANGPREAIIEAEKLKLEDNPYYFTLLGELYRDIDKSLAQQHFQRALLFAATQADRDLINRKIQNLA